MSTQIKSSTRFSRLSFTYLRKIMDEIIELVIESYLEKFETACNFFSFSLLFSFLREQTLFRSLWPCQADFVLSVNAHIQNKSDLFVYFILFLACLKILLSCFRLSFQKPSSVCFRFSNLFLIINNL